ncbi:MAG: cation:proton antiporter, partial [Legionella sp.]
MTHSLPLLTTIATALAFALILGFIAVKIKLPALVGYLLAGIIIGPFTPGVMANIGIAAELAEVGVMLLMFGVGLHFSVDHLLEMRHIALPGALIQIIVATCLGCFVALSWGWSLGAALVFGLALSVASTVVLVRALEAHGLLGSINGQISVSWLIVEDMAMVFVLVFLPLLAQWLGTQEHSISQQNLWLLLLTTLLKITAFFFVMVFIGRWLIPKVLWHIARTGS